MGIDLEVEIINQEGEKMEIYIEDVFSSCCGALPFAETYFYSDLDLVTGLCSQCKEHCHFLKEGEEDE